MATSNKNTLFLYICNSLQETVPPISQHYDE